MALRNQPPEAYELLDQRDEEQILQEIKGNILTEMFYSFRVGGKEVTGISWVGTKEIARKYGNVKMDFVDLKDMGDEYMAIVRATDTRTGTGMLGTSIQAKMMEIHDLDADKRWLKDANGNYVTHLEPDKFSSTKAISKAQRNAIRAIIPERFLIEMYEQFKRGGKPEVVRSEQSAPTVPRKPVKVEAKPVDQDMDQKIEAFDDEERRVQATLDANGLPLENVFIEHQGNRVHVHARPSFPREMKKDYDRILGLLGGKWQGLENRWEVPVG